SIARGRDLIAHVKREVNERQDRKYRQDHGAAPWNAADGGGRVHRSFVAMRLEERDGDDDSAEGADSDQELSRPVMMEAVGMAQHFDDDHDQQRRHEDACEEARHLAAKGMPRAGGYVLVDQVERLEERIDGKHADEGP